MLLHTAARSASAFFQSFDQISSRTLQCRISAHRHARKERQKNGEPEHGKRETDASLGIERKKIRRHFRHERNQLICQACADCSSKNAYEQTFENEKSQHARAGRPQGHAQRDLSPTAAKAYE